MWSAVVSQARCPTPLPFADACARCGCAALGRLSVPSAPSERALPKPPCEILATGGSIQAGFTTKDTKSTKAKSRRCRCPEPGTPNPNPERSCAVRLERRSDLPIPSSYALLLRVLRALRGEIRIAGARAKARTTRIGVGAQPLYLSQRHGGRVVKPLPHRVSPGERDQGFRTDSAACLPKPCSMPDAPCAS